MFKKLLSVALTGLFLTMVMAIPASAESQAGSETQHAENVKKSVTRLGTGKRAGVEVKLKDNTKLKGYIGAIAEEHFTVIDPGHGTVTPVPYVQVQKIKSTNRSTLFALLLGAGVIGGILLAVVASGRD